jgi:hypothetical protein
MVTDNCIDRQKKQGSKLVTAVLIYYSSTMASFTEPDAAAATMMEELPIAEVSMSGELVSVKWGKSGSEGMRGGVMHSYGEFFVATDDDGNEPRFKTFGSLFNCVGGVLPLDQKLYRINSTFQTMESDGGFLFCFVFVLL